MYTYSHEQNYIKEPHYLVREVDIAFIKSITCVKLDSIESFSIFFPKWVDEFLMKNILFQYVSAFAVSALASNWDRLGKPFNPLLGETYELQREDFR